MVGEKERIINLESWKVEKWKNLEGKIEKNGEKMNFKHSENVSWIFFDLSTYQEMFCCSHFSVVLRRFHFHLKKDFVFLLN
jgi:hypothetical protein